MPSACRQAPLITMSCDPRPSRAQIALAQKWMITKANLVGKPVMVAAHLLESMGELGFGVSVPVFAEGEHMPLYNQLSANMDVLSVCRMYRV